MDSQFAERIILQRNEYIQIDNELLQPGDTNYKSESQIIADAQKAMKDLNRANLGYKVEYVVIGGNGAFDDVYRAELEEKLQKLKE
ncbi:hypothetical protein FACS1894176_07330 [Bacteroidia bacterium]|nr:hypothetical protein FACS1894176_07330 [Bacteroidia bacterium]